MIVIYFFVLCHLLIIDHLSSQFYWVHALIKISISLLFSKISHLGTIPFIILVSIYKHLITIEFKIRLTFLLLFDFSLILLYYNYWNYCSIVSLCRWMKRKLKHSLHTKCIFVSYMFCLNWTLRIDSIFTLLVIR